MQYSRKAKLPLALCSKTSMIYCSKLESTTSVPTSHSVSNEAAIQTLKIVTKLTIDRVTIEGDTQNVIIVMHGITQFQGWKTKQKN